MCSGDSSGNRGGAPGDDISAPTAVSSLSAAAGGPNQINLSWSAASDDVSTQAALIYEICYGTAATDCDEFTPLQTTGKGETTASITGLLPLTQYFTSVRAVDEAGNGSEVASTSTQTDPEGGINSPVFSPAGGVYGSSQSVSISSGIAGAVICYATDGTTPDCSGDTCAAGTVYGGVLSVTADMSISAIACRSGYTDSIITTASYTIDPSILPATPVFNYAAGTYTKTFAVGITSNYSVFYTTDGTTPDCTGNGTLYKQPNAIPINVTTTLKAITCQSGTVFSDVASAVYTLQSPVQPQFSVAGGNYSSRQLVDITTTSDVMFILYTKDGTTPDCSGNGRFYSHPIPILKNTTLQAIACGGSLSSSVATATYTFSTSPTTTQQGGAMQLTGGATLSLINAVSTFAGKKMSADGFGAAAGFSYPTAVTSDGTNLYVADQYNHTIRRIVIATGAVTTLAGTAGSPGSTDGTGSAARFDQPTDIITDGTNLYLTDQNNHTIRQIAIATGAVTTVAGTAGSSGSADGTGSAARFNNPAGITTDGTSIYVADQYNHTIRQIVITTGVVTTLAGTAESSGSADGTGSAARLNMPTGITTDGTSLYVADQYNYTIRQIVIATGEITTLVGTAESFGSTDGTGSAAKFDMPTGITTDGTNLYVTDRRNNTIRQIVIATGEVTTMAGTAGNSGFVDGTGSAARFYFPYGITTDGTCLYVADLSNHTIRKIDIETKAVTTMAGTAGNSGSADGTGSAARFYIPAGITTDGTSIYVADLSNNTIRQIDITTGEVTTLAGTAGNSDSVDGTGSTARFSQPYGITTDGTNLYVTDQGNNTIRKIVIATGAVTTLAGTAGSSGYTDDTGSAARFSTPAGITTDGTYLYVADQFNDTIRKIVIATKLVTTLAGTAGSSGSRDDIGSAARFSGPTGITTDGTYLYVADQYNGTIRQIVITTGEVTTLAGTSGSSGSADGTGSVARFFGPAGITTDGTNLYVSDFGNHTIRQIVITTGAVTTLAGTAGSSGSTDDTGSAARFMGPTGITTDGTSLYVTEWYSHKIRQIE